MEGFHFHIILTFDQHHCKCLKFIDKGDTHSKALVIVRVCVFVYVCVHVCVCVCVYVFVAVWVYVCLCVSAFLFVWVYVCCSQNKT